LSFACAARDGEASRSHSCLSVNRDETRTPRPKRHPRLERQPLEVGRDEASWHAQSSQFYPFLVQDIDMASVLYHRRYAAASD